MRFYNIFFSPTGGTEKVADIVAKGTKLDAEEIDLIKEPDKLMKVKFEKKDLCLVAVPSYGGRIPSVVTDMKYSFIAFIGETLASCTYSSTWKFSILFAYFLFSFCKFSIRIA